MKLIDVIHKECGNAAYKADDREYDLLEPISEGMLYCNNGELLKNGSPIRCEHCRELLSIDINEDKRLIAVNWNFN